jgi:hypothetical protein
MKYNCLFLLELVLLCAYPLRAQSSGISWPEGRAFPWFATPTDTLDGLILYKDRYTADEICLFSVLQGLVNKTKPSVFLFQPGREGMYKWPNALGLIIREYPEEKKWELVRKYSDRFEGVILYSVEKSFHYRNLAGTVAGLKNALPVTAVEYEQFRSVGINLPIVEDLSQLAFTQPEDIYRYLYDVYWKDCSKRLLISHQAPGYIRDMAAAAGTAILWLDPRREVENKVMRLFLRDMKAGESIILGWWAEERSGIGIGTEYGISTIPADFYENSTVYAGMNHEINLPVTPKKPELENKIYVTVFLSDGDNIQYCQHTLPVLWDNKGRGAIPVNWTVSPGLADLGPGILNYFYKTASPNDFFASGPSGLGYALMYDAHNHKWFNTGGVTFDKYAQFTQTYLERSGLRVITAWDQINEMQMEAYTTYCRYLYGVTQQDWEKQERKIPGFIKQNKLAFLPNFPCYTDRVNTVIDMNKEVICDFDGSCPVFLTTQGVSWRMGFDSVVLLKERLEQLVPGNIVFCRGDHFFALYNEANHLDFNLTLSSKMEITSSATSTQPAFAADGTCVPERSWISSSTGEKWIQFDFKETYRINRYVIRHADNMKSFSVATGNDGKTWRVADQISENISGVTDRDISPVRARYVRINVTNAGENGIVGIGDVEIYGSRL